MINILDNVYDTECSALLNMESLYSWNVILFLTTLFFTSLNFYQSLLSSMSVPYISNVLTISLMTLGLILKHTQHFAPPFGAFEGMFCI